VRRSRFADLTNLRRTGEFPFSTGALNVNDSTLAKLVITFIVLISLAIWAKSSRYQQTCDVDCSTDFSASRK
jgi:hypothetical protein